MYATLQINNMGTIIPVVVTKSKEIKTVETSYYILRCFDGFNHLTLF